MLIMIAMLITYLLIFFHEWSLKQILEPETKEIEMKLIEDVVNYYGGNDNANVLKTKIHIEISTHRTSENIEKHCDVDICAFPLEKLTSKKLSFIQISNKGEIYHHKNITFIKHFRNTVSFSTDVHSKILTESGKFFSRNNYSKLSKMTKIIIGYKFPKEECFISSFFCFYDDKMCYKQQ